MDTWKRQPLGRGDLARRIAVYVTAAALLAASGACTSADPADTTSTTVGVTSTTAQDGVVDGAVDDPTTTTLPPTTTTTIDPALAEPLVVDADITIGELPNGLDYMVAANDSPGGRAELRLVVDVGSVAEGDNELGMAHFLEHMMFNGTERFPRNELTAVLESFGPRFGPDINAYTSYDETVYMLSLSADDDLLDLGMEVLREWAGRATITETDVIEERGVVLDEWRLRDQGVSGLLVDAYEDGLLVGTSYEGKRPIGNEASIANASAEVLRGFYERWYTPDRMTIVAVGDFDVDEMVERIDAQFADMQDRPSEPIDVTYTPSDDPSVVAVYDPEIITNDLSLVWPEPAGDPTTVGSVRAGLTTQLAADIFARRLNDDALRGTVPLVSVTASSSSLTRSIAYNGFTVTVRPNQLGGGIEAVMRELARAIEFGFHQDEFERVAEAMTAAVEQEYEARGTRQDAAIAGEIVEMALSGTPVLDEEERRDLLLDMIDSLTVADIEDAFVATFGSAPVVLVSGPTDQDPPAPDEASIAATVRRDDWTVQPREAASDEPLVLMEPPQDEGSAKITTDPDFGSTTMVFTNGATVRLWPTTISENSVFLRAESWGGTSQLAVEDLAAARIITDVYEGSGLGALDAVQLQRVLDGKLAGMSVGLSETREVLTGAAATDDLEILFQLLHLTMTAPRADQVAIDTAVADAVEMVSSVEEVVDIAAQAAMRRAYYGDDPRYALPTPAEMLAVDAAAVETILVDRFSNPSDFVFALIGDFDLEEAQGLARRYIGSMVGTGDSEDYVDNQPLPPRLIYLEDVRVGTDPEGSVSLFFTNQAEYSLSAEVTSQVLEAIVNMRLRDRIREELGVSYSPFASVDLQREPDPFLESFVRVTGAPETLAEISDHIIDDLADLQRNGPTDAEFATAIEQIGDEYELISNGFVADLAIDAFFYPDQPETDVWSRWDALDAITREDVRRMAATAFNLDQRIEIRTGPE